MQNSVPSARQYVSLFADLSHYMKHCGDISHYLLTCHITCTTAVTCVTICWCVTFHAALQWHVSLFAAVTLHAALQWHVSLFADLSHYMSHRYTGIITNAAPSYQRWAFTQISSLLPKPPKCITIPTSLRHIWNFSLSVRSVRSGALN